MSEHQHAGRNEKRVFRITGMDCADCAQKLEKRIGALAGVENVGVNYGAAKMTLLYDGESREIIEAVKRAGYSAEEETDAHRRRPAERSFWRGNGKAVTTLVSGALFLAAWILGLTGQLGDLAVNLIYAASIVAGGYRIAKTGLYGLKAGTVGMDLLMTIAVLGAAVIGQWAEGAAVVVLFSLGETLEAFAMDRTRQSIRSLMDLAPHEALIRRDGREQILPVAEIRVGDILIVKPGEKLAMDGKIISGDSTVNQAPITGESVPVEKSVGDDVFAGTINQQGALEVEVTKLAKDNTLARIIEMVEEAQARKAPSQRFVDTFAKYYTPAVLLIAAGIALIPPLLGQDFAPWFYRALVMLVISCPCALVISTPVSIVSAIGNAARNGVLVKGGAYLERLGALRAVAFDKTGTLTEGVPQVTIVRPLSQAASVEEMLSIAASIESRSEHPLAQAVVRYAVKQGIAWPDCDRFRSITGKGTQAHVNGELFYLGNPRLFADNLNLNLHEWMAEIDSVQKTGNTVMLLGTKREVIGLIGVADQVRAGSRGTIEALIQAGVNDVYMLTGDNEGTARTIAAQVGGIAYQAELMPEEKVAAVEALMAKHGGVAMVGDGVNDAPALAAATVGIAMGAAGTDTALETADIALMDDDLSKIPYAIHLSRRTVRIIKENIAFAIITKAIFLAMVFPGWATLWMAVMADTGASLLVILNGMRLLRTRRERHSNRPPSSGGEEPVKRQMAAPMRPV